MSPHPQAGASVQTDIHTIEISAGRAAQIHDYAGNVLGSTQSPKWVLLAHHVLSTEKVDLRIGQARGEEPRSHNVGGDVLGRELEGEITSQVVCCRLGHRVHDGASISNVRHDDASNRGGD